MRLSVQIDLRSFVVLNAEITTVERALRILSARQFVWAVLQIKDALFLFARKELRERLQKAKATALLMAALGLDKERPSVVVSRRNAIVTIEEFPESATPACRAVVARKDPAGRLQVTAVGMLRKAARPTPKSYALSESPKIPQGIVGDFVRRRAPAKKSSVKRAPAKKAAKKSTEGRVIARKPFGFGFAEPRRVPKSEKRIESARDYETVEVFYATDREQKRTSENDGLVRFLNVLPDPAELRYGICSVTVPHSHKLGKIETPSIWTLMIQNSSKHFTLSACSPRTKGEFFKQLSERVGKSEGRSCFVFIHGYNVSFEDAAMRTAQLAKDLKFPGVPILYSWASAYKLTGYSQDEETVSLTIKRLTTFLKQLTETSAIKEIHLIAHSMGNRAMVGALDRLGLPESPSTKRFKQVVLTAPDVPRKDVESLIEAASLRAERVTLYASRKDKALGISKAKHKYERLGKVYGFPYVLVGMDSIDASNVRTDFLAHTVFAKTRTVLGDLQTLIAHGDPPDQRFGLTRLQAPAGICWKFAK